MGNQVGIGYVATKHVDGAVSQSSSTSGANIPGDVSLATSGLKDNV